MKNTKRQILIFTIFILLLSCIIVMVSFNFMMQRYIDKEAVKALRHEMTMFDENNYPYEDIDYTEFSIPVYDILLDHYDHYDDYLSEREKKLIAYWEENPGSHEEIRSITIDHDDYYVAQLDLKDEHNDVVEDIYIEYDYVQEEYTILSYANVAPLNQLYKPMNYGDVQEEYTILLYANVTPLNQLYKSMNVVFLVILLVLALLSVYLGMNLGKRIENSQERLKQFFQNVSHELKTPIMSIQGYAEGIQTKVIKDQTMATQIIIDESQKMSALVEELLYISKIDSGQMTVKKEPIEINELIYDCLRSIDMMAKNHGIKIKIDFDETSPIIYGDEIQLAKAFTNIIVNALKYAESQVSIKCNVNRNYIEIVVSDDGDGISEKDLPHVFERFYTGEKGNTGIGLALTKEIIEAHNGKITTNNRDKGAAFNVMLRLK